MNGKVQREYVRRLSRNVTNLELGLIDADEYRAGGGSLSELISNDGRGHHPHSKTQRGRSAEHAYQQRYKRALEVVRGTHKQSSQPLQGTLKRRKTAPSLRHRTRTEKEDAAYRVLSPYFPNDDDREEEEEEDDDDEDVVYLFEKGPRTLGRKAAAKYPRLGLLDSSPPLPLPLPIGIELGQTSFEVEELVKKRPNIPREDGTRWDDDPNPYSDEWQQKEIERQKILAADPNYQFIFLLSGFVKTPVVQLFDEDRLEDVILRRLDVQRQMRRIRQVEEARVKKIPELELIQRNLQNDLETIAARTEEAKENEDKIKSGLRALKRVDEARDAMGEADARGVTLQTAKNLLITLTKALKSATWITEVDQIAFSRRDTASQIQRCTNFLLPVGQVFVGERRRGTRVDVVVGMQTVLEMAIDNESVLARAAFVCMAYLVALILDPSRSEYTVTLPKFTTTAEERPGVRALRDVDAMTMWRDIITRVDGQTGDLMVLNSNPPIDLTADDDASIRYRTLMEDLRDIWVKWAPIEKRDDITGRSTVSEKLMGEMTLVFEALLRDAQATAGQAARDVTRAQRRVKTLAQTIPEISSSTLDQLLSLPDWEDALTNWIRGIERSSELNERELRSVLQNLEKVTRTLREMEIIQPPRVKYQHRKGWVQRPEHSGNVPLDSTVVAGIQAAMDLMQDVKSELVGERVDHLRNVMRAGTEKLQHDKLSRGAFARLVASRMALQEEMFPTRWTRRQQFHRIRLQAASALRSLSGLYWTGKKFVSRSSKTAYLERSLMTKLSIWRDPPPGLSL